ncbi:MAG: hypothetical protein AAF674_16780 [Pseudomonadota bacterium]
MSATKFYVRRQGMLLAPLNDAGEAVIDRLPHDRELRVNVVRDRSRGQHGMYHLLCHRVSKCMQEGMGRRECTPEWVKAQIKMAVGHTQPMRTPAKYREAFGSVLPMPKSTEFDVMDGDAFAEFFSSVIQFVVQELLPHLPAGPELNSILSLLDENERYRWKLENGRAA